MVTTCRAGKNFLLYFAKIAMLKQTMYADPDQTAGAVQQQRMNQPWHHSTK